MGTIAPNETNSTGLPPGHPFEVVNGEADVAELRAHQDNTYAMDPTEIESLAENILEVGLISPVVVRRVADGGLQILSGHRRVRALRRLARDHPEFARVPVRIYEGLSDEDALLVLHSSNITRHMTQEERRRQSGLLKAQVAELRKSHPEWRGVATDDIVASMLGVPARTWRRQVRLARRLDPRLHSYVDKGLLYQSDAETLAGLDEAGQARVADALDRSAPRTKAQASGVVATCVKGVSEYRREFEEALRRMDVAYFEYREALGRAGALTSEDRNALRSCRAWIDEALGS